MSSFQSGPAKGPADNVTKRPAPAEGNPPPSESKAGPRIEPANRYRVNENVGYVGRFGPGDLMTEEDCGEGPERLLRRGLVRRES